MELSGKELQQELLKNLHSQVSILKSRGTTPGIAIVTLGPEETWEAYVGQKIKLADQLGINKKLINLRPKSTEEVIEVIEKLNNDPTVHGLIVQRPFPIYIDTERIIQSVSNDKDIDGFRSDSKYEVPVWLAVKHLITHASQLLGSPDFTFWLSNQSVLVVGRGQTAGKPVIDALQKMGIRTLVIDSKTEDTDKLFEISDIIIFATGKRINVPFTKLKKNSILIGIGLHREYGKLIGDFDENEAKKYVSFYSPSPGGVGPLNLYFLFENLIKATKNSLDKKM